LESENLNEIFPRDVREELFIKIRRSYFEEMIWRDWPKATKATVPVIMKHSNASGYSFPSQTRIAIYSGLTEKSVRQGLNGLQDFQDFRIKREFNRRGWMKNKYWFRPASINEKGSVFISHAFFNGGNWSLLSQSAKAIYPVLKYFCYWDYELYEEYEEVGLALFYYNDVYKGREYDFLNADPEAIAKYSGVNKKSIFSAFQSLENHYFMEPIGVVDGRKTWKLFTQPPFTFNTYMNKQVKEKYNLKEKITY
jgi:Helix-turn-helix domain